MSATILSNTPLGINGEYAQPLQDRFQSVRPIGGVRGLVYADQAGTLYLEESDDKGDNWSTVKTVAVSAETTAELSWTTLTKRWYRFRYANGATAQGIFALIQQTRGLDEQVTTLSGSSPADITKVLNGATQVIANGGTYFTDFQNFTKGNRISVSYKLSASKTTTLNITWYNDAGNAVHTETLVASGARLYGGGSTVTVPSSRFKVSVVNGAAEDITLNDLYVVITG